MELQDLVTLAFLVLLQAVLGFDNLLYISIESKRVAADRQSFVRRLGIGLAIVLRIILLFVLLSLVEAFQTPMFGIAWTDYIEGQFNVDSVVTLLGGGFIIYTAMKEIFHMLATKPDGDSGNERPRSVATAVFWIVTMNAVFSFDSILSAMALTRKFWIMATAIVISGALMIWLADRVSTFLQRNRMYEVLGLFILFVVGVMLVTEGGEKAHLTLFGEPVEHMSKTTFYFVIAILVVTDVVQSRYQRKLLAQQEAQQTAGQ